MTNIEVPLFPLTTVLFPHGVLPLRIFEPRYLSMVAECMRNGSEFGVVLIIESREPGIPARFHQIGTLARIEDFDQLDDGHLGITCRGSQRFKVLEHAPQEDLLVHAVIETLTDAAPSLTDLPEALPSMRTFLRDLMKRDELKEWLKTIDPDWDNPLWLSCRLAELLPLSMESRQILLEMPLAERLSQLSRVMRDNKLL